MRFSTSAFASIAILVGASNVSAAVLARDYNSLLAIVNLVTADVVDTTTKANAWSSDPTPPEALYDAALKLINDITNSIPTAQASTVLSLGDAIKIITPVKALNAKAVDLRTSFQPLRTRFGHDNVCDIIRGVLSDLYDNGQTLINTMMTKVPPLAQSQAQQQADQFIATLNGAKTDFSAANCVDAIDINA